MIDIMNFRKNRTQTGDTRLDIRDAGYVVIDTELTGLDEKKDSIVSIGAVKMKGGIIELGNTFYRLIHPETKLTAESVVIHEITPSDVSEKPSVDIVLSEFLDFCGSDIIVGFCVSIDMEFLGRDTRRFFGYPMKNHVLDILPVYEWVRKKEAVKRGDGMNLPQRYRVYDIAKYYGIDVSSTHNAIIDAYITAQIFQRFIPVLIGAGIQNVGDLMKLSGRLKGGERQTLSRGLYNF
jgi:DNA polymerase-3 subunit epsilon